MGKFPLLLLLLMVLTGCYQNFSAAELVINQERGNLLVAALTEYHSEHNTYPEHLSELVPTYLAELPQNTREHTFFYEKKELEGYRLCLDMQIKPGYAGCCYQLRFGIWDCTPGH